MLQKFENLVKITKSYAPEKFFELGDRPGWSDGFIADLTPENVPLMKAQAIVKNVFISENKPKINPIIAGTNGSHEVSDVQFDLLDNTVFLVNHEVKAKVDPKFIKYFWKSLNGFDKLILTGNNNAVKVIKNGKLAGLIMPIRTN